MDINNQDEKVNPMGDDFRKNSIRVSNLKEALGNNGKYFHYLYVVH
jgi:hypothetical protein